MTCESCGAELSADQRFCPKCGHERGSGRAAAGVAGAPSRAGGGPAAAFTDVLAVVRQLLTDPVGRMGAAFSSLTVNRAMLAGLAMCAIFAVTCALGVTFGRRAALTSIFGSMGSPFGESGFVFFLKSMLQMLIMPAAMIGISYGIRRVAGNSQPIAHDVFIVGASLLPIALTTLVAGLLGSLQLALLLVFIGGTFAILMLFSGLTSISGLATRTASLAVPLIIVVGGWLSQRVLALFE